MKNIIILVFYSFFVFSCTTTVPVNMDDVSLIPKDVAVKYINENINKNYYKSFLHRDENKTTFGETISVTETKITYYRDFLANGTRDLSEVNFSLYQERGAYVLEMSMNAGLTIRLFTNYFSEEHYAVAKKLYQALISLGMKQKAP
ncbi:MAG: hypothetical protein NE328_02690 [Lentisphaeraceae bacterium]|nr:hypothetical protein [Lentisphaeraceae bacterium]